jgi:hypothetical protein
MKFDDGENILIQFLGHQILKIASKGQNGAQSQLGTWGFFKYRN